MAECVPTPVQWVREQVELYESSGGTQGAELMDTGLLAVRLGARREQGCGGRVHGWP